MQRVTFLSATILGAFLGASLLVTGCSPKPQPTKKDVKKDGDGGEGTKAKTAIKAGKGKIVGRIVYDGAAPKCTIVKETQEPKKEDPTIFPCKAEGEGKFQNCEANSWHVGTEGGVADVLIYVKTPKDHYFEPSKADLDRAQKDVLWIKQPHCAFIPHVTAVWQYYLTDGKPENAKPTGQVLKVINDNKNAQHNTDLSVDPRTDSEGGGQTLAFNGEIVYKKLKQGPLDPAPATISCNVHKWMNAKVWAFDHPYARVTKVDGKFEIDNVPDQDLTVVIWHDGSPPYVEEVPVKNGSHDFKDYKVKAK